MRQGGNCGGGALVGALADRVLFGIAISLRTEVLVSVVTTLLSARPLLKRPPLEWSDAAE